MISFKYNVNVYHMAYVIGTRRIDVEWTEPDDLNGVVERYLLYMSVREDDLPGGIVYNSSDVGFRTYRNESLTAGTTYYISLGVSHRWFEL